MLDLISKTLIYSSGIASIIPVAFGLYYIKRLSKYLLPILLLCFAGVITEISVYVCIARKTDPWIINALYTVTEFVLLVFFYRTFFKPKFRNTNLILLTVPMFLIVGAYFFTTEDRNTFLDRTVSVESLFISLFALTAFILILKKSLVKNILAEPFFYVNAAALFYFLGNLAFFALAGKMKAMEPSTYTSLWIIHSLLNITFNLFISIGFWKTKYI